MYALQQSPWLPCILDSIFQTKIINPTQGKCARLIINSVTVVRYLIKNIQSKGNNRLRVTTPPLTRLTALWSPDGAIWCSVVSLDSLWTPLMRRRSFDTVCQQIWGWTIPDCLFSQGKPDSVKSQRKDNRLSTQTRCYKSATKRPDWSKHHPQTTTYA